MQHRTTSTSTWWPGRMTGWQLGLWAGFNSALSRYLLALAVICALGCAYLWQTNKLSELQQAAAELEYKADGLEKENIRLAEQSAHWNTPAYIEKRMHEEGYVNAQSVVYAHLPTALVPSDSLTQQVAHTQAPGSQ